MKKVKMKMVIILSLLVLGIISAITYAVTTPDENSQNPVLKNALIAAKSNNESDPLEVLTGNKNFQRQGIVCKETRGEFKIAREQAIELAIEQKKGGQLKTAKKITAIRANLTDPTDQSPNALRDHPVWIVTFHETQTLRRGPIPDGMDNTVIADCSVVIDGNTGEWLTTFGYDHS